MGLFLCKFEVIFFCFFIFYFSSVDLLAEEQLRALNLDLHAVIFYSSFMFMF